MKKTIAALLCLVLLLTAAAPVSAAPATARLYNVYADNMLFQRDADAVFAGEAPDGCTIAAELCDRTGALAASGKTVAENGCFSVSFPAPAGGYETYTVKLFCNGTVFAELKGVVFGELWLAFGQSNMEYPLNRTAEGKAMEASGETGPHDVHILWLPAPILNGEYQTRYLPQNDAIRCHWMTADDPLVYNVSAPAYFFAVRLQAKLDMPVGILSVPLGGSAIAPWLSRKAIDGSATVKRHLTDTGTYYGEERWRDPDRAMHLDMTNLYNTNIAPLIRFRPQGAIWYQGCSDLILGRSTEYYRDCFDLLQDSYTADFGYTRGRMPFIFTQIACYDYGKGPYAVTEFNEVFTDLAKADPASRGEVTIYDLSLAFNELGAIHPMTKKPVGERMFRLAESLVYGRKSPSSAPTCKKAEVKKDGVYLTFENAGGGLQFVGGVPRGFAVCGEDGIAVEADAELVSGDTVRVYSDYVKNPVAATYAAGSWSERANLYGTYGGEPFLPAAPFGIRDAAVKRRYADNAWMNCENETFFASCGDSGYIDTWKTAGCTAKIETRDKTEGDGALRVTSRLPLFTLSPQISEREKLKWVVFDNADTDWSDYGVLRMQVMNNGKTPVRLQQLRLYTSDVGYVTPVCRETGLTGCEIPADGLWHPVVFELDRLLSMGAPGTEKISGKPEEIKRIQFLWEGVNADILLDDIRVLPGDGEPVGNTGFFRSLTRYLKALFAAFLEKFRTVFDRIAVC